MHAMIDLETLNVGTSAPLFEIGICVFDINERKIYGSTQFNVDLLDVILTTGFCPNQDTIKIKDGLSNETIAAIRADLARSYELAVQFKPSGVKT